MVYLYCSYKMTKVYQARTQHHSKGGYILLSRGGGEVWNLYYYATMQIICGRLTIKMPLNCTLVVTFIDLLLHDSLNTSDT